MADLSEVYASTRRKLADLVVDLPEEDLQRAVPATPGWTIFDVTAHLSGVLTSVAAGEFPREFFSAIGSEHGIAVLNEWTGDQVNAHRKRPLQELLTEWEEAGAAIMPMLAGDEPWPGDVLPIAGHILMTDLAVHQQDIHGALGLVKDREEAPIRIGFSVYTTGVDLRLRESQGPPLRFVSEHKEVTVGGYEPAATVTGPRFELFRALSGRRNPEQVRAYDWSGDPEPFLEFFYPYGVRSEALVE